MLGQSVTISINIQAYCNINEGTVNVPVTGTILPSDNFSGSINISVLGPALTIIGHPARDFIRGFSISFDVTVINGAAGPVDSLLFYIKENRAPGNPAFTTDSIKVGDFLVPRLRTAGDTIFYLIPPGAIPGGALGSGQSINITRFLRFDACPVSGSSSTNFNSFDDTYFVNYLANGVRCQSPVPSVTGRFNYQGGTQMPAMSLSITSLQSMTTCQEGIQKVRITNVGQGTVNSLKGIYDVSLNMWEAPNATIGHQGWPMQFFVTDSATLISPVSTFNFASLVTSGGGRGGNVGQLSISLTNRFTSDPDGANFGLADLDGDGFFDDLPSGAYVELRIYFSFSNIDLCSSAQLKTLGKFNYSVGGRDICNFGIPFGNAGPGTVLDASGGSFAAVDLASPPGLVSGQTGTVQAIVTAQSPFINTYGPQSNSLVLGCNINTLRLFIPLAPGVTIPAVRFNGVSQTVTVNGTGDTARVGFPSGSRLVDIDLRTTQGVTPANLQFKYGIEYVCTNTCPPKILGCQAVNIGVPAVDPCNAGGVNSNLTEIKRTTAGFTNYSGTTRVDLNTVSPINRKRGLPCDSVLIAAAGVFNAGTVITGGESVYYQVKYNLHAGSSRLFAWRGGYI